MKQTLAILTALIMVVALAACTAKNELPSTTAADTVSQTETASTEATAVKTTAAPESSTAPKTFDDWTDTDLSAYFKADGIFDNEEFYMLQTGEAVPDGVTSVIIYDDFAEGDVSVTIFYFEKDSKNSKTEEVFNKIKKEKKYVWHAESNDIQPFNAVIGRFAVFYELSRDKDFKQRFEASLDKLIKEQHITPIFYNKGIDVSDFYKDNDKVIIVESDDE